jgi:hypothetical protein
MLAICWFVLSSEYINICISEGGCGVDVEVAIKNARFLMAET